MLLRVPSRAIPGSIKASMSLTGMAINYLWVKATFMP